MDEARRASAVETLLARLSGEVAPIWITFGAVVDRPLDVARLRVALGALVAQTPRLNLVWDEAGPGWRAVARAPRDVSAALRVDEAPRPLAALQAELVAGAVELGAELPLRLHWRALEGGRGPWMLAFQLHHAIGDARALCRLATEFWRLYEDPSALERGWGGCAVGVTDGRLWGWLARSAPGWLGALGPGSLLLAPRGASLPRDGEQVGAPTLAPRRVALRHDPKRFGGLVMAALAVEAAKRARGECLRLRMPVDLAAPLGVGAPLANTCVAIPVELDRAALVREEHDARALRARCREALRGAVRRGVPQVAVLECLVTARLVGREALRKNARPGLLAHPRTNTLVATHVGPVDASFARMPARIVDAWGHTPTWGLSSISLGQEVFLQCTSFEGLVSRARLEELADAVAARLAWLDERLWEGEP